MKFSPKGLIGYLKEVRTETKKVNWPTRRETIKYTVLVIVIALAVSIFLGALDLIFRTVLREFIL